MASAVTLELMALQSMRLETGLLSGEAMAHGGAQCDHIAAAHLTHLLRRFPQQGRLSGIRFWVEQATTSVTALIRTAVETSLSQGPVVRLGELQCEPSPEGRWTAL